MDKLDLVAGLSNGEQSSMTLKEINDSLPTGIFLGIADASVQDDGSENLGGRMLVLSTDAKYYGQASSGWFEYRLPIIPEELGQSRSDKLAQSIAKQLCNLDNEIDALKKYYVQLKKNQDSLFDPKLAEVERTPDKLGKKGTKFYLQDAEEMQVNRNRQRYLEDVKKAIHNVKDGFGLTDEQVQRGNMQGLSGEEKKATIGLGALAKLFGNENIIKKGTNEWVHTEYILNLAVGGIYSNLTQFSFLVDEQGLVEVRSLAFFLENLQYKLSQHHIAEEMLGAYPASARANGFEDWKLDEVNLELVQKILSYFQTVLPVKEQ